MKEARKRHEGLDRMKEAGRQDEGGMKEA